MGSLGEIRARKQSRSRKCLPPLLATALLLAGCQTPPQGTAACQLARAAVLPFRVSNAHLLVDMTINDAPATLVFDTGAFTTVLDSRAVTRLGLATEQPFAGYAEGVGGRRPISLVVARTIDLGGLHGRNFHFAAADFEPGWQRFSDGLVSTDFLSKYDIDLDFPGHRIILYYPQTACRHASAYLDQPLYGISMLPFGEHDRTPKIEVQIGGHRFAAAIDTGAPGTLLFRSAASSLGLRIADLSGDRHFNAGGIGPAQVRAIRHVLEPITLGDLTIEHMPVAIVDQAGPQGLDMLLGLDFQSRVHLWISYASKTLIAQFPPKASPDLPAPSRARNQ